MGGAAQLLVAALTARWEAPPAKQEPDLATRREVAAAVRKALPPREALIVLRHFGLPTGKAETLAAVAEDLSIGRERCRQLLARALRRLGNVRALRQLADLPPPAALTDPP